MDLIVYIAQYLNYL